MALSKTPSSIPTTKVETPPTLTKINLTSPTSNGGGLIGAMNKKNELLAEQNKLLAQKNEIDQYKLSLKADIANQKMEIQIGKTEDIVNALFTQATSAISNTKNITGSIKADSVIKELVISKLGSIMEKHTGISKSHFDKKDTYMDNKTKHLEKEKEHLDKNIEHLDHAKNGNPNLKNSDGEVIIPRDANALHNSEKAIETANMNKTDFGKVTKNIIDELEDDEEIDINIMVTAIDDMFNLDGIDFDNLPKNLKEGV